MADVAWVDPEYGLPADPRLHVIVNVCHGLLPGMAIPVVPAGDEGNLGIYVPEELGGANAVGIGPMVVYERDVDVSA